ncbi:conserved unknown protein [Ectocarpus siliculosus]|uniref:LysM domain-containing protein n=1 Tax=Ectocarpus siliculosus TaxID=2880 RepID=D8LBH3_ECTSI|nr:conserved unknown protein [Ectocarpus siliculosus]|eukprot:CBN76682.1 conserved unknown protein [Ectocarpus siliculosus]
MGPRKKSYNYGTFIASPGHGAEEDYGGNTASSYQRLLSAPAPAFSVHHDQEYRIALREDGMFGLRLTKHGGEVVLSEMDDDVARARGLCEGDVVTHMDGEPLLGSLKAAAECMDQAGDSLSLRVQSGHSNSRTGDGPRKAKYHVVQHIVRQGDSVEALAEQYGVTADEVRIWNRKYFPVGEPGCLCPGQVLTLRDTTADQAKDRNRASLDSTARRRKSEGDGARKRMLYQVREGDSLKSICARLKLKEGEVRGLNRGVFPVGEAGVVLPGQTLTVFAEDCDILVTEEGSGHSTEELDERAFIQDFTGRKTKRSSLSLGIRGAGVMG